MFSSIVVGTDGSDTASTAVRHATHLARRLHARLLIVSAYAAVSRPGLRSEGAELPKDLQWMVNPPGDVLAMLEEARDEAVSGGVGRSRPTRARATPPTRSSISPRSSALIWSWSATAG
jgi:nucleotide-binding universal stress UspA family protein